MFCIDDISISNTNRMLFVYQFTSKYFLDTHDSQMFRSGVVCIHSFVRSFVRTFVRTFVHFIYITYIAFFCVS